MDLGELSTDLGMILDVLQWEQPSLKLAANATENRGPPGKGDSELGNHHFKGQTVSFREDMYIYIYMSLATFFWSPPKQENLLIFVDSLSICSPEATGDLGFLSTNDVDLIVGCLRLWRLALTARWLNHVSNEKSLRCLL